MDLLNGKVKPLYFKYLSAAFGSTLISCIYGMVDMAMVGQYQGPEGAAALAVVAPVWNMIYSLGRLMGIGGSVLFSTKRGGCRNGSGDENQYFTAAVIGAAALSAAAWACMLRFERPILLFFGADESLLIPAQEYLRPIQYVFPLFLFNQMLAAFFAQRQKSGACNARCAVGRYFQRLWRLLFCICLRYGRLRRGPCDSHRFRYFFSCDADAFYQPQKYASAGKTSKTAAHSRRNLRHRLFDLFIDVAMGILTVLFNRQIMKYLGSNALAIYGPIINISTFVQCGQAAQPIVSINFGAGKGARIRETLWLSLLATAFFGLFWTAFSLAFPNLYVRIFMTPTQEILDMAPAIIRTYSLSFLLLPFNIFSTYYFQAIMKPRAAFVVSVARGFVISGILILILPAFAGADSLWLAMPVTELLVMICAAAWIGKYTKALPGGIAE